jgi:NADH-ubiquinone oxidoreductase chain 5
VFFFFGASLVGGGELFLVLAISIAPQMFMLVGGCTKRAQVPFVGWLPLAIRAPTPVSSLVHRSTLVTAGVYLILRYFALLRRVSLCFLFSLGLTTRLIAGAGAVVESDTKKVVALSTLSQLGLLTLALGASLPILRFCHLIAHAFLKSCLFLQVGVDIHGGFSTQSGDG